MIKKFLSGSQFYIYSAYLPTVLSLFTLPLITPFLTLRDYGIYGVLFAVYNFLSLVFNLGFTVEYQNSYFNEPNEYKQKWSRILGFQIIWNFATAIPFAAILLGFVLTELTLTEALVSLGSLILPYLILDPIKTVGSRHFQYSSKHFQLFVVTIIGVVLQFTTVIILIIKYRLGFEAWLIGNLVNSLFVASVFKIYLSKVKIAPIINFARRDIVWRIKTQSAIVLHNISGYLLEMSDRVVLSLYKVPIEQIGTYNIAYNYTNYGQTVNNALNTVFSPVYFQTIKNAENALSDLQMNRLFRFWIKIVLFLILNMIIWADYLFAFLYRNPQFSDAFVIAAPMVLSLIYRPFYVIVVSNLIIQEKNKFVALISFSSAVLNIVLNLIFVPYFGIKAAIYSTAFSYVLMGFMGLLIPKIRKELTKIYLHNHAIWALLIILSICTIHLLDFASLNIKISIFIVATTLFFIGNRKQLVTFFRRK